MPCWPPPYKLTHITALTNVTPELESGAVAGTTISWPVKTAYYTTTIPIWLDEVDQPAVWSREFLAPEAREVLSVLGAFVICFRKPVSQNELAEIEALIEHTSKVCKEGCGLAWDGVCIAVAMPQSNTPHLQKSNEEWEELCMQFGFEYVDFETKGRNEFGEVVGLERLREALESNEWDGGGLDDIVLGDDDDDNDNTGGGFTSEAAEAEHEFLDLKRALIEDPEADNRFQDNEVEKLQEVMSKMHAIKGMCIAETMHQV